MNVIRIMKFYHIIAFICFTQYTLAQEEFTTTLNRYKTVLSDKENMSFKTAVFLSEKAFDIRFNQEIVDAEIANLKKKIWLFELTNSLEYEKKDKSTISKYASIFKVMTDTTEVQFGNEVFQNYPFNYNFNDIFGSKDWSNMFVTKLLATKKGNCHSLPYLYKILCNELNVPCHLALAPNHLYIKHRAEKGGWYNTELTSASFPIDAWLMASGYISLEAVQNGIYLDTLSAKENISLCVIDLAQGYNHKYAINDGKFVIECCDLALQYFPDYVNAMILKAETKLKQLEQIQEQYHYPSLKAAAETKEGKPLWKEMNNLYGQIHKLGYRQMPEKMYVEWLTLLKTEREKYSNKQFEGMNKK